MTPLRSPDDSDDLLANFDRLPDLSQALRDAPPALKRQIFDAFGLSSPTTSISRRIAISATISDAVARHSRT